MSHGEQTEKERNVRGTGLLSGELWDLQQQPTETEPMRKASRADRTRYAGDLMGGVLCS